MRRDIVLRGARHEDLPAILELTCRAFGEAVRPRMAAMLSGDASLRLDDLWLAEVDGTIASCVRIADRSIRYGESVLRMGGIGAVSTLPSFRGQGLSSAVLAAAFAQMRAAGYHLCMLFTGIQPFYARLGWTPFPEFTFRVPLGRRLPAHDPGDYAVRPFDLARDLTAVEGIYDAYSEGRVGPVLRSHQYWRDEHARVLGILPALVAQRGRDVIAYVSLRIADGALRLTEAACARGEVAAFRPLAAAIIERARTDGLTIIAGHLPRGHGLIAALQELGPEPIEGRLEQGMMLRVVSLSGLLRAALPTLRDRLAGRAAERRSLGLRVAGEHVRLAVERGELVLDEAPAARVLDLSPGVFFRLFFGERPFPLLIETLAVQGIIPEPEDVAFLSDLFPPQDPIYWPADHF